MNKIVTVELLKEGDRIEFITERSEWSDNCFLPHPKGVVIVAKNAFLDPYKQCRFGWRLEKFPDSKPQDWWGAPYTEVRLLGTSMISKVAVAQPSKKRKAAPK